MTKTQPPFEQFATATAYQKQMIADHTFNQPERRTVSLFRLAEAYVRFEDELQPFIKHLKKNKK